jgi:hypothetical protein
MSKKYLSLEEAAAVLRMGTDELIRLRERGGIRGFADRGTWKFREEDVLEVQRSRQADSDPDVPLLRESSEELSSALGGDDLGEQPTIISKGMDPLKSSDSEVKLVGSLAADVSADASGVRAVEEVQGSDIRPLALEPESGLGLGASDSAVARGAAGEASILADDSAVLGVGGKLDSDSEVKLVAPSGMDSDSDVKLVGESSAELNLAPLDDSLGSDSDVRLVFETPAPKKGSDSDVKLVQPAKGAADSDSDVALLRDDDESIALDFTPDDGESASVLADESGIALVGDDSAMLLKGESGISLEGPSDSGVALQAVEDESITLDISEDSGISLETAADSGISLESVADSGISLEDSSEFGGTIPMMKVAGADDDETAYEIPALKDDSSEYELATAGKGSDAETAVFDLADAEEALDDSAFELDDETAPSDEFAGVGVSEDELEVGEDVLGEDDELEDLDVFDEEAFEEGMTPVGQKFAAPVGAVAVEQDWGAGPFIGLVLATTMLAVVGVVMFDLVYNLWAYQQPTAASSMLLDALGGLYGKK